MKRLDILKSIDGSTSEEELINIRDTHYELFLEVGQISKRRPNGIPIKIALRILDRKDAIKKLFLI